MECRRAGDIRLHGHGLLRREMLKIVDAVRVGACENRRELVLLIVVGRDDQFAAAPMFYAALSAKLVQRLLARNAQLRLGAARRIIDARMDDLGIARTGAGADGGLSFDDDNVAAGQSQRARHRQADNAGACHDRIDAFGHAGALCLQTIGRL